MARSRYNARYDTAEDRDILTWYHEGKSIYSIAKELNRTPNAIKRRIDETIIPLQNAPLIYNTPKPILQPTHTNFQTENTTKYRIEQFNKPGDYMSARLQEEDARQVTPVKKFFGLFSFKTD